MKYNCIFLATFHERIWFDLFDLFGTYLYIIYIRLVDSRKAPICNKLRITSKSLTIPVVLVVLPISVYDER